MLGATLFFCTQTLLHAYKILLSFYLGRLYLRTVLGVDRKFNLGPCFVTCIVYKSMSVKRVSTQENPIFLGPILLHFDALTETYRCFFSNVADAMGAADVCTEVLAADMVFGSDDEKALVNALHTAFPAADHVYRARHIEENVRRHLTEKGAYIKTRTRFYNCCSAVRAMCRTIITRHS